MLIFVILQASGCLVFGLPLSKAIDRAVGVAGPEVLDLLLSWFI